MILVRSVIYFAAMVITVVFFGLLIALLGRFMPGDFSDVVATRWGRFNLWLQRAICGLRYEIHGLEHLPADGPCIIMAKHQSTWETIGLRGILKPQQSWVLKQELLRLPIFGWALRFAKSIPIDRSAGRRAVIEVVNQGISRLAEGRYVIIFPEGTRTAPGQRRKYGMGGAVLAERSAVPVIPVAHNAGVFWRRRGVKKYPGTIQLVIGSPIDSTGKKAAEIIQEVEDWIEARQLELPISIDKT
jgi:1-acyl-sn-glycerol-3-phosphate acyltransferase